MPTARTRVDACPGVVSPHLAADGALARIRLPGGMIGASALRAVADLATVAGDGAVHLTSRGNLQLRGLDPDDPRPVERLVSAGLLPSRTHERVRNVLASPLSGVDGGVPDVRGLAAALDRGLCARPELAALPGRFLFAVDDGRGDVAAERPDVCWLASCADDGELLVAGARTGLRCSPADAPGLLLDAAAEFLRLRDGEAADRTPGDPTAARAWRAAELPDAASRIADGLPARSSGTASDGAVGLPGPAGTRGRSAPGRPAQGGSGLTDPVVGPLGGGAIGAAPELGELSAAQVHRLADLAPDVIVTPWRTLVLPAPHDPDGAGRALRDAGLVVEPGHAALRVSACAGTPGCAKSLADVRTHARTLIAGGTERAVHASGCTRRCGAPHTSHVDLVATGPDTYEEGSR